MPKFNEEISVNSTESQSRLRERRFRLTRHAWRKVEKPDQLKLCYKYDVQRPQDAEQKKLQFKIQSLKPIQASRVKKILKDLIKAACRAIGQ